jgi:DNA-directed RNA polymerase sigma subunit (sigma70/sigma32)
MKAYNREKWLGSDIFAYRQALVTTAIETGAVDSLDERSRRVLEDRYAVSPEDYKTLGNIAEELQITRAGVHEIEKDAIKILESMIVGAYNGNNI